MKFDQEIIIGVNEISYAHKKVPYPTKVKSGDKHLTFVAVAIDPVHRVGKGPLRDDEIKGYRLLEEVAEVDPDGKIHWGRFD